MPRLSYIQQVLEYLGGEIDEPPGGFLITLSNSLFWGLWWCMLMGIIYIFSGQSSKFIYIDF